MITSVHNDRSLNTRVPNDQSLITRVPNDQSLIISVPNDRSLITSVPSDKSRIVVVSHTNHNYAEWAITDQQVSQRLIPDYHCHHEGSGDSVVKALSYRSGSANPYTAKLP